MRRSAHGGRAVKAPTGQQAWLGDFLLLAAAWGASFMFMRIAVVDFGPFPTAGLRVGIAAAFLLPLLAMRRQLPLLRQHWRPLLVAGILNSAIPFACYAFALVTVSTGLSAILNATVPLFGAVVAWVWLNDRPAPARIAGLCIGFAGVALLAAGKASFAPGPSGIAPGWGVLACLVATAFYGVGASYTRVHLAGLPALVTATGSQCGATLALALPALWWRPAALPGTSAWLAVLAVGVLCTGVAYILFFRLIERAGPARALAVTFVIPVFAVAYGVLLLGETVTPRMLVCGLIIAAGTALSTGLLGPRRQPTA